MQDLEVRRKRIETIAKIAGLAIAGALFAPFALATITGLLSLIVVTVVGLLVVNIGIPWFAMKLANWRLKSLKAEASKNPIETLENQYKVREQGLVSFRENILAFHAEVQNFYSELEENRDKLGNGVTKFEEQYAKMKSLLASRGEKYKLAQKKLKEFADIIEQKRCEWKIAQAAAKMTKAAGVGDDFLTKLMADTAIDSVQTSLNTAFAELEVSLLDEQPITETATAAVPATVPISRIQAVIVENSGPPVLDLDLDSIPARQKVSVS